MNIVGVEHTRKNVMIKRIKNTFLFVIMYIFLFFSLILKYYFSDNNKKNSYRSIKLRK